MTQALAMRGSAEPPTAIVSAPGMASSMLRSTMLPVSGIFWPLRRSASATISGPALASAFGLYMESPMMTASAIL
jgi:hypothetical protein